MERTNEGLRGRANNRDAYRERGGEKARIGEQARKPPSGVQVTTLCPWLPTLLSGFPTPALLPLNRTFLSPDLLYPFSPVKFRWILYWWQRKATVTMDSYDPLNIFSKTDNQDTTYMQPSVQGCSNPTTPYPNAYPSCSCYSQAQTAHYPPRIPPYDPATPLSQWFLVMDLHLAD
ncbi:unnamed protein product [Hymenolepis diminuta]|uniref:Uncharacterized protein n=1 Tax=Hymenolepis diminuta TaxID=6216 RepID=A0A564YTK5_HYMDI|nr:unnamed protein product [Hymenolepis diminuta]